MEVDEEEIERRQEYVDGVKKFIMEHQNKISSLLQTLSWTPDHFVKGEDRVSCPYQKGHVMPDTSLEKHKELCQFTSKGCPPNEALLQLLGKTNEPENSIFKALKLDAETINRIVYSAHKGAREVPVSQEDYMVNFSPDERLAIQTYYSKQLKPANDVLNVERDDFLTIDWKAVMKKGGMEQGKAKTKFELLAELRDMKRRRQSYRAKNVHITKKSYTEIIREVINNQLDILIGGQSQSADTSSQGDHQGVSGSFEIDSTDTKREVQRSKDTYRDRDFSRHGKREREIFRGRSRERSHDRDRGRSRERSRGRSRQRSQDRDLSRSREWSQERDQDRSRERSRGRSKERSWDRDRGRSRDRSTTKFRERSKERLPEKSKERSRDRHKKKEKKKSKHKHKSRQRDRSKERETSPDDFKDSEMTEGQKEREQSYEYGEISGSQDEDRGKRDRKHKHSKGRKHRRHRDEYSEDRRDEEQSIKSETDIDRPGHSVEDMSFEDMLRVHAEQWQQRETTPVRVKEEPSD